MTASPGARSLSFPPPHATSTRRLAGPAHGATWAPLSRRSHDERPTSAPPALRRTLAATTKAGTVAPAGRRTRDKLYYVKLSHAWARCPHRTGACSRIWRRVCIVSAPAGALLSAMQRVSANVSPARSESRRLSGRVWARVWRALEARWRARSRRPAWPATGRRSARAASTSPRANSRRSVLVAHNNDTQYDPIGPF